MDNSIHRMTELYKRLIDIGEQQISLFQLSQSEDAFSNINVLEKEKTTLFTELEILTKNQLELYSVEDQETLRQLMETLLNVNDMLRIHINNRYNNATKEMKQVSMHRKTLNSYGGANSIDVIPYYFDEKK